MATRKKPSKRQDAERRERIAAARAAAARAERRATLLRRGGIGAAAAVAVGVIAVVALRSTHGNEPKAALPDAPAATASATTGSPPWPAPADASAGAKAAGLRMGQTEGTALHFHTHLDVLVDGKPVPVPANLGIDQAKQVLSELHTHDTSGVLHVEAPDTSRRYVLGQLFSEWNVRLEAGHLGGLTADAARTLTAYVDGTPVTGDPARIELRAHREIALVFGAAGAKPQVPSRYAFPDGE